LSLSKEPVTRNHPYPNQSFICYNCEDGDSDAEKGKKKKGMVIITCSGCNMTSTDWWYSLGEIWENLYETYDGIVCQCCYFDHYYLDEDSS
jgi:hypothetical protein